jgi:septal ring factor EnvC (AmiA/AmiB activator)
MFSRAVATGMLIAGVVAAIPASAADDPETRLRAALKSATSRIRDLEEQNATLTAKQAEFDRDKQAMTQKAAEDGKALADLRQQADSDKAALDQGAALQRQQQGSLAKLQATYTETAETARTRDADAKRLDTVLGQMRPRLQSCEAKNAELYKLGEQVLDLYDKKDFFDIVSGEPVTKLKRVELENTMQDYEDKMRVNKLSVPAQ